MIRICQLKLQIPHKTSAVRKKAFRLLALKESEVLSFSIVKRSLDARKKPQLFYVYTVEVEAKCESRLRGKVKGKNISFIEKETQSELIPSGEKILPHRPVIIGTGPAGLFCGYQLALLGYRPLLLERGASVEERKKDVEAFWNGGALKEESNVQFGEGGAGTFSDGKLNTLVHDTSGRNHKVLRIFVRFGAPESILYDSKPHIGTDVLEKVVKNIRKEIIRLGGDVRFHTKVTGFEFGNTEVNMHTQDVNHSDGLLAVRTEDTLTQETSRIETSLAVLAIGHSARDTFEELLKSGFDMSAKSFAVGVRVEHAQAFINESRYGKGYEERYQNALPAAAYKLTAKSGTGRGVYTFCMCPGGYVVNASSEEGRLAVNGMSYSGRNGRNANSAVIVSVTPADYGADGALAGMEFQRRLEEAAYREGQGSIPVQLFGDFVMNRASKGAGKIIPQMKGNYRWANVRSIFPEEIAGALEEGIYAFDREIKGYAGVDTILSGVESRTSSPVRITRDETLQSNRRGVFPCGEGAGYAGGITSAAMDGLKVAESIIKIYRPFDKDTDT